MAFRRPGPNSRLGVPLPWTQADPYIRDKSWRLASRLLMVMGVTVLISWRAFWISTAHLVGLSCLYTVILYRWKYGTWRFWKETDRLHFNPVARCRQCGHLQKLAMAQDLPRSLCAACGVRLPDPRIGVAALWPPVAKKGRQFLRMPPP
jgi:hypothetical protein